MFKQTEKSRIDNSDSKSIIEGLGAITLEQQKEFASITGRFDTAFKIGKPTNIIIGKSVD